MIFYHSVAPICFTLKNFRYIKHVLSSYAGFLGIINAAPEKQLRAFEESLKEHRRKGLIDSVLLDSGAFTAWKRGMSNDPRAEKLTPDSYLKYCVENLDCFDYFVTLDTIALGERTGVYTDDDFKRGADATYKNFLFMKKHLPVERLICVFHQGESVSGISRLTGAGCRYLGISARKDIDRTHRIAWLREFPHVPNVKVHLFGISGHSTLAAYPHLHSADGSWAFRQSAMKRITLWNPVQKKPFSIFLGEKTKRPCFFDLPQDDQDQVERWMKQQSPFFRRRKMQDLVPGSTVGRRLRDVVVVQCLDYTFERVLEMKDTQKVPEQGDFLF